MTTIAATPRVRELRVQRGLTQAALADLAGIARQSLIAIESGRATPSVAVAIAVARALEATVEALFAGDAPAPEAAIDVELLAPAADDRVAITAIDGRWIAAPLELGDGRGRMIAADGVLIARGRGGAAAIEPLRARAALEDGVLLVGCAPALGLVADRLNAARGPGRFTWIGRSSSAALHDLAARRAQVVGVHFGGDDERTLARVRRALPGRDLLVIGLVAWEAGLALRPGAARPRALEELGRPGVRLALRERGAGIQRLFEAAWRRRGAAAPATAALHARGHLEAAQAVALGAADAGLTIASAARRYGLDLLPLGRERFDLVIDRRDADDPRIARLLEGLSDGRIRRALAAAGDDAGPCGDARRLVAA
ncbi:MAG: substrate-binding domain-containing protein [Nannocystaceae bacterium]